MKLVQRFLVGVPLLSALVSLSGCSKGLRTTCRRRHRRISRSSMTLRRKSLGPKRNTTKSSRNCSASTRRSRPRRLVAKIGRAEQKVLEREVEQPGWIMSMETTPIYTFYPAYIQKIGDHKHVEPDGKVVVRPVDRGDIVKKDDVLATLFVPEREYDLTLKKALVDQSERELKVAETFLKVAEAHVELARRAWSKKRRRPCRGITAKYERWESELARIEVLAKKASPGPGRP